MARLSFKWSSVVPMDQIDKPFIQGMLDRMVLGYHNYGHMRRKYSRPDNIKNVRIRLAKYLKTGNMEWLMDAANYCMMEFAVPAHVHAHFRSTDSHESPGAIVDGRLIKNKREMKPATGVHAPKIQREGD